MDIAKLATQPRPSVGSRPTARLRKQGLIPAVVYGHKQAPVSITLKHEDFEQILRHHHRLVELGLGHGGETALIKEVQHDHLGKAILHVDFERVDKDEKVIIDVEVKLKGTAPGTSSGVLDQPLHSLKVECLAANMPEVIAVNISALQLGQAIHVKELVLPPGVVALNEPDAIIVQVKQPVLETEAGAAVAGEGGVEPEIVGRRVKAEEPAGEK